MQEFSFLSGQEPALPESGGDRAAKGSLSSIEDYGSITLRTARATVHIITIVGQIEGHTAQNSSTKTTKYEHIIPQLAAIEQSPNIDGLLILLNTVGGDVEAGLAIAEVIASMTGKQLKTMLVYEGLFYALGAAAISLALTLALGPAAFTAVGNLFWFFTYRLTLVPFLVVIPIFALLGILVPLGVYRSVARHTIVERLREAET